MGCKEIQSSRFKVQDSLVLPLRSRVPFCCRSQFPSVVVQSPRSPVILSAAKDLPSSLKDHHTRADSSSLRSSESQQRSGTFSAVRVLRSRGDRFPAEAAALYEKDPQRPIVLRADRKLAYGEVKEVTRTLRDAGFQNVGLIAEKQKLKAR